MNGSKSRKNGDAKLQEEMIILKVQQLESIVEGTLKNSNKNSYS